VLRYLTAGESHGPALVATIDGLPAHIGVTTEELARALARRRLGYGRGARMSFERDSVRLLGGVRWGESLGGPIAVEIANSEWPKWAAVMSADPIGADDLAGQSRAEPLTRPRPGHADLAGMQKYDFDEARPILERASARETAARVALGALAQAFLDQALGIHVLSHVVAIGAAAAPATHPTWADRDRIDADPVRCADPVASGAMRAAIDAAREAGDTLGGIVEVLVFGCPPGLGSHVQADRRLDARLAGALMGIPAIKGVEAGDGFALASLPGSAVHDPIVTSPAGLSRPSDRAGGLEGGMTTGQTLRLRAAMKPIATVPRSLPTVDVATGQPAAAHHQRSDISAVPAAGVVAEAVVALEVADAALAKFGGDTVAEVAAAASRYRARLEERRLTVVP
jgi:chorismate synthase